MARKELRKRVMDNSGAFEPFLKHHVMERLLATFGKPASDRKSIRGHGSGNRDSRKAFALVVFGKLLIGAILSSDFTVRYLAVPVVDFILPAVSSIGKWKPYLLAAFFAKSDESTSVISGSQIRHSRRGIAPSRAR